MRKPASKEINSDSVELCERLKFVSYTSNLCERTFYIQRYVQFLPRSIFSVQGPQQSESLGIIPLHCVVLYYPHDNIVDSHSCDECTRSNEPSVRSHALIHFVTARASLITDDRMSGLPFAANYKYFRTICEHTFVLPPLPILLFSSDGRQDMVKRP